MIQVENYFDQIPERLKVQQKQVEKQLLEEKKIEKGCWKNVKTELLAFFHNKCAYCETSLISPESIDHFRPKAKDKYYWLAHEWTNFLPCCKKCQDAKKDDFFAENPNLELPLLENGGLDYEKCRADSDYLLRENALILHPVLDNPNEHLSVEILDYYKQGRLNPKTAKGEITIQICKLNEGDLVGKRREIIRNTFKKVKKYSIVLSENGFSEENIEKEIFKLLQPQIEESLKNHQTDHLFVWKEVAFWFKIL